MGKISDVAIAVSIICIVVGVISRLQYDINILTVGARGYIGFAGVLLLLAIALMIKQKLETK